MQQFVAVDQRGQPVAQQITDASRMRDGLLVLHHREDREPGRHRLGVGAEARGVHQDPVHRRVDAAEDPVLAQGRPDRHIAAGECLGDTDQIGLHALLVLVRVEVAGPAEAGLHLVGDEQGLVLVQQLLRRPQEAGRRGVDALALDRLDDQCRHVAALQLAPQGVEIAERDGGVRQQGREAVPEAVLTVDREGAGRQPVEGVGAVEDPGAAGGVAGEFQGRLDRFGAAVPEEDPVQVRAVREQPLGQQSGQRLAVEAGQIGERGVQDVVQRLAYDGVVLTRPITPNPASMSR